MTNTWWVQGFVQDQKLFCNQKTYIWNDGAQDYHDVLSQIFKCLKDTKDKGYIHMTLNFGDNMEYDIIYIPVVQFITGDCKGSDLIHGYKGGHSL